MAKSNTTYRVEFIYKVGHLFLFASLHSIKLITPQDGWMRTAERQNELFKEGKSKRDGYKKKSMHQLGRAVDIAIIDEEGEVINEYGDHPYYEKLGKFWEESMGGQWGGNFEGFRDVFHFQY